MHVTPMPSHACRPILRLLLLAALVRLTLASSLAEDCNRPTFTLRGDRCFGTALVRVGDLDGDGVFDYAGGAPGMSGERGAVHVISGKTATLLVSIPESGAAGGFGRSLASFLASPQGNPLTATAYLLVGSPRFDRSRGRVTMFEVTQSSFREVFHLEGEDPGDLLGSSTGSLRAGGGQRFLIGAPGSSQPKSGAGKILVVDLGGVVRRTSLGEIVNEGYGVSVAGASDVNGDGIDDVLVGSLDSSGLSNSSGGLTVYDVVSGTVIARRKGAPGEMLGCAVAGLGDIDSDGFGDLLVGASGHAPQGLCDPPPASTGRVGRAYMLRGGAKSVAAGGTLGEVLRSVSDDDPDSGFGASLTALEDLDGDGAREFAVGAPWAQSIHHKPSSGRVMVFEGKTGQRRDDMRGFKPGVQLGSSLVGISDQDLDGAGDLLVGKRREAGEVALFSLGDIDSNGTRDACEACALPEILAVGGETTFPLTRVANKRCFRLEVPRGTELRIRVDGESPGDRATILLHFGASAQRDAFDLSANGTQAIDPGLLTPPAPGGPVYLAVEGVSLERLESIFRLRVEALGDTTLFDLTPDRSSASPGQEILATIRGDGIPRDTQFSLVPIAGGKSIVSNSAIWLSPKRVEARFDIGGAPRGRFDLLAMSREKQVAILKGAFEVTQQSASDIYRVALTGPRRYRNNSRGRLTARFENLSSSPLKPLLFQVVGPADATFISPEGNEQTLGYALAQARTALTADGSLPPGASVDVPIWFRRKGHCGPEATSCPIEFELRVFSPAPRTSIDWKGMPAPTGMNVKDWAAAIPGLARESGSWGEYCNAIRGDSAILAQRGLLTSSTLPAFRFSVRRALDLPHAAATGIVRNRVNFEAVSGAGVVAVRSGVPQAFTRTGSDGFFVLDWLENGAKYTLEVVEPDTGKVRQSNAPEVLLPQLGDLHGVLLEATAASTGRTLELDCPVCESVGLPQSAPVPPPGNFVKRASFTMEVVSALDPNEKNGSGSQGGGEEIDPLEPIQYQIFFENEQNETGAAARRVEIEDLLPPELDWSTVELLDVVVDTQPELVAFALSGSDGSGTPGGSSEAGGDAVLTVNPSSLPTSGDFSVTRAEWHGEIQYLYGEPDQTVRVALTIVATVGLAHESGLDGAAQGAIDWTFESKLNNGNGAPAQAGFLPFGCPTEDDPEAVEIEGETGCGGHVSFTVLPRPEVASGTVVSNDADIIFDQLDPVVTDPASEVTIRTQEPSVPSSPSPPSSASPLSLEGGGLRLGWEAPYADTFDLFLWDAAEGATRPASRDHARVWESGLPANQFPGGDELLSLEPGRSWRWQVVSRFQAGGATEGPVWELSTGTRFRRADADASGQVEITDAIAILGYLFLGGVAPACLDALDADDSDSINITDAILTLAYLFLGDAEIPAPGPVDCGMDPAAGASTDELSCSLYSTCE